MTPQEKRETFWLTVVSAVVALTLIFLPNSTATTGKVLAGSSNGVSICGEPQNLKLEGGLGDPSGFVISFTMKGVQGKIYLMPEQYVGDHPDPDGLYRMTIVGQNRGASKVTSGYKVKSCPFEPPPLAATPPPAMPNPAKG